MLSSVQGPFKVGCCCLSLQALGADRLSHYLGHLFARGAALIHHFPTLQEPSSHPDVRPSYQLNGYMWLSQVETKHDYIAHIVRMSPAFNARSALQCFKHSNVSEISNRINVRFLPWTTTHQGRNRTLILLRILCVQSTVTVLPVWVELIHSVQTYE